MAQHTTTTEHSEEHHGVAHVAPLKILIINGTVLLILTWLTVAVANFDFKAHNIYEMNIIIALAIAVVKAALVCLFFMHLWWDRPFNSFVLVGSIAFVALFMGLAMLDTFEYSGDKIRETPPDVRSVLEQQ
jgi:cytochrome c oxidase subunit IV